MATQLDFSTRQLANPSAGVQQNLHDLGAMFGQFNKERADKAEKDALAKERADERAFQREQADISNKRAEAMLGIQQAQEGRAVTEQAAKEATRQAYGKFGELATASNQTQAQVAKLMSPDSVLAKAQATGRVLTPQEEALVAGQVQADLTKNKGSLTQQRQLLLEQAPVTALYDTVKDPTTGLETVRTKGDIDTSLQQAYKQSLVDNLDKRIGDEANNALKREEMLATEKYRNRSLNLEAQKIKEARLTKPEKTVPMFRKLSNGETHRIDVPISQASLYENPKLEGGAFTLGTVGGSKTTYDKGSSGAAVDWEKLGGSTYLGAGTGPYELKVAVNALKAKYPKVKASVVEDIAAASSDRGLGDSINTDWVDKQLRAGGHIK